MILKPIHGYRHLLIKKRRSYAAESACYKGEINLKNPARINWFKVKHPTGTARYRMAARGVSSLNTKVTEAKVTAAKIKEDKTKEIVFIGGSDNPYNYNGIGYNGKPSTPSHEIWRYNINTSTWSVTHSDTATMDHRGLLQLNEKLLTLGGMSKNQQVLNTINFY